MIDVASAALPASRRALEGLRWRVWGLFFLNGLLFSTWAVQVPAFQDRFELRPAELSLGLFMIMLGNFAVLPLARVGLARRGLRWTTLVSVLVMCFSLAGVGFTRDPWLAGLGLLGYGLGFGGVDFALNAAGAWLEGRLARPVMSVLHSAFSVGTLVGAGAGATLMSRGVPFHLHLAGVALLGAALGAWLAGPLFMTRDDATEEAGGFVTLALVFLLVAGFTAALCEGIVNDWSSVFLRGLGLSYAQASWGFVAFSLMMVIGRVSGDWLTTRAGRTPLAGGGMLLSLLGFGLVSFTPDITLKFTGFALAGLGVSVLAPLSFSAAWGHASARGVALMTAVFYGGFLAGPPVTGLLVERYSLSVTFLLPLVMLLLSVLLVTRRIYAPVTEEN